MVRRWLWCLWFVFFVSVCVCEIFRILSVKFSRIITNFSKIDENFQARIRYEVIFEDKFFEGSNLFEDKMSFWGLNIFRTWKGFQDEVVFFEDENFLKLFWGYKYFCFRGCIRKQNFRAWNLFRRWIFCFIHFFRAPKVFFEDKTSFKRLVRMKTPNSFRG